jgi:hypothetical protein
MDEISKFKCPYIDKREIWERAENFREKLWPEDTLPVDIENIIEKRLKLNIEPEHNLLSDYDIDAYLRVDLTGIVVDYVRYMDERFINRLRFSFAHELGHLFLHKDIYAQFGITDTNVWKRFMQEIPEREYKFFEYQANEFAGRVLVPRDRLETELEKCIIIVQEYGLLDLLASDPDAVLANISPALCKPFGVSDQVIERRVDREEIWPPKIKYIDGVGIKLIK